MKLNTLRPMNKLKTPPKLPAQWDKKGSVSIRRRSLSNYLWHTYQNNVVGEQIPTKSPKHLVSHEDMDHHMTSVDVAANKRYKRGSF